MINKIVELFYELSRKHKLVRTFKYDNLSKAKGVGDERMLSCYLEEPLFVNVRSVTSGTISAIANIDIVGTLQFFDNVDIDKPKAEFVENLCYSVALNYIAKIRDMYNNDESDISVESYSIMTLERWDDNSAYGVRATLNLLVNNDIDLCNLENHFDDEEGDFDARELLPRIETENPQSCSATFEYKLPKIRIE